MKDVYRRNRIFNLLPIDQSLNLSLQCQWVIIEDDVLYLSAKGMNLFSILDSTKRNSKILAARQQLAEYIGLFRPYWSWHLSKGRVESLRYLPEEIKDIFFQLGLYDPGSESVDDDMIVWWDEIALSVFAENDMKKCKIGRYGERISIIFEEIRTGKKPEWIAVDSNQAGYDILSVRSKEESTNLCIEVKTSTSNRPRFYFTRNEWSTAETKSKNEYLIYFWKIIPSKEITLYVIDSSDMIEHFPNNIGVGRWEDCSFEFEDIPPELIKEEYPYLKLPAALHEYLEKSPLNLSSLS
ncbi:DUF3883 domain-containing protein [Candidatus Neomarinimicrobiota bacterium]